MEVMDSTRIGSKWIKVAYHRPPWPPRQPFKRHWRSSPPQVQAKVLPVVNDKKVPEHTESDVLTSDTQERLESSLVSETDSSSDNSDGESASSIKAVSNLMTTITLEDLTLKSLSDMAPANVLKIVTSGDKSLLRRLDITMCDDRSKPRFMRNEQTQRLDVIRYINKTAPVRVVSKA